MFTVDLKKIVSAFALTLAAMTAAHAQDGSGYPNKPVRLIIPFAPGGGADYFGRLLGERLSTRLGQPVVVDNRGGAGGAVGTEFAARAAPDGYTLVFVSNGFSISPAVSKVQYDPMEDFAPIARVVDTAMVLAVNPSVQAKDLRELVAYAKANPDRLSYGSSGVGGAAHLATEEFLVSNGVKMVHVPYKGTGPANTALVGGEIQVNVGDTGAVHQMIQAGRVKALAIGSRQRSPLLPSVPTTAEAGFPDAKFAIWYGLLAPKGTAPAIVERLNREVNAILATPEVTSAFTNRFAATAGGSPADFAASIRAEYASWKRFAERTGTKP